MLFHKLKIGEKFLFIDQLDLIYEKIEPTNIGYKLVANARTPNFMARIREEEEVERSNGDN